MRFIFTCGGSGGHINPAIATADALRALLPGVEILFIGAGRDMEKRLVPAAGYKLVNIDMRGFERGFLPKQILRNADSARLLLSAFRRAGKIIGEFRPEVVLGTGGSVCYPVLKTAAEKSVPTALHNSDVMAGLASKLASKHVSRVFTAFPDVEAQYKHPERVSVMPTPVRAGFGGMTREQARRELNIPEYEPLVVSLWGSLGGMYMNEMTRGFIVRNARERKFRHIHATGGGEKRLNAFTAGLELPDSIDVRAYIDDMPRVMAAADLILCRAGASTLAELCVMGRASVLVPSPYVPNDHQTPNAAAMQKAGAAVMLREADCSADAMWEKTLELLGDKPKVRGMERCAKELGDANAAERMAWEMINMIRE